MHQESSMTRVRTSRLLGIDLGIHDRVVPASSDGLSTSGFRYDGRREAANGGGRRCRVCRVEGYFHNLSHELITYGKFIKCPQTLHNPTRCVSVEPWPSRVWRDNGAFVTCSS